MKHNGFTGPAIPASSKNINVLRRSNHCHAAPGKRLCLSWARRLPPVAPLIQLGQLFSGGYRAILSDERYFQILLLSQKAADPFYSACMRVKSNRGQRYDIYTTLMAAQHQQLKIP